MRNRKLLVLFVLLLTITHSKADNYPVGSRAAAMGYSTVMLCDIWSLSHNQAGMAWIDNLVFGAHFENIYFVEELGLKAAVFGLPVKPGVFGISISHFGYSEYNEIKAGLSFAKTLGNIISVGIQLDYYNVNQDNEYGNQGTVTAELGILAKPVTNLSIGAHVFNPTGAEIEYYDGVRLPTIIRFGAGYEFAKKFLLTAEVQKESEYDMNLKAGAEYKLFDNLFLRAGINSNPSEYADLENQWKHSFGLGFLFRQIKADLAFSKHPVLDYTVHFSVSFGLK